ncbi:23S rRNA (uracil(1939)-C(5))-methyltransferase RlmD [Acetatifactor muris]|uniref:23S rRNA (uracil(1939)-C(5))-methyltransferase RlmD n=1 Tax=Acetatifactor muris TaxID=879566 RepID=UPI0023F4B698|nr:23S rRNA (uracil(1939)-C(5))-methyltransferase RlmD [Acetatifactor muris]
MKFEKNEIVTVTIEDIGNEGEGIGRVNGFTLFVKDAVVGDTVEARIVKNKKTYAYGRLEKVLVPSPFRVEPKCAWHRQCGGCQLQACSYERQLIFKQDKIRSCLIRIGGFAPEQVDACMEPIVGMEDPFRYRNKAQYPVGTDRDGNVVAGFYAARTHNIIAHTDCWLGPVENETILNCILEYMRDYKVSAYDENTGTGLVRHILIRKGFASGEIMVCLVINAKKAFQFFPDQDALLEKLTAIEGMTSVSVSLNPEQTNVIMGKEIYTLWGKDTISDTIRVRDMTQTGFPLTGKELTFAISPLSFYQVNPVQTEKLYSLALEYAGLTGQETVWDLYCGIGTISLFLAGNAGRVYGVEVISQAIEDAGKNAERNGIENAAFFVGKAEDVLQEIYEGGLADSDERMLHPDVIVVDPPRKGCDSVCLEVMLKMRPERIVYVSCDPATLARDLKVLCGDGYALERVRGVDQFGGTVHVETVVLMSKVQK